MKHIFNQWYTFLAIIKTGWVYIDNADKNDWCQMTLKKGKIWMNI